MAHERRIRTVHRDESWKGEKMLDKKKVAF